MAGNDIDAWFDEELKKIPERAKRAGQSLRSSVAFPTRLKMGAKRDYFFAWSADGLEIVPYTSQKVDCTIATSLAALRDIADRELNPQIALLSGKAKVEGNAGVAIYFFNLLGS